MTCPCGEGRPGCIGGAHPELAAVLAAVAAGDIDAAIDAGLLQVRADRRPHTACPMCQQLFTELLVVRDERRTAWAARDRYQARTARLSRRRGAHDAERAQPSPASGSDATTALPPAAAAALSRALARAGLKS